MDDAYSEIGEDLFKFLLNIEKKIITILLNSNSTQIHSKMTEDVWYSEMNSRIWIHFWYWKKKKKNRILLNSNAQIHSKMADDGMVFRDWWIVGFASLGRPLIGISWSRMLTRSRPTEL